MEIRKIIQRKIERRERGLDLDASVNAVIAANVGERGQSTHVSAHDSVSARSASAGRAREANPKEETER
jgi:hypothetical protein